MCYNTSRRGGLRLTSLPSLPSPLPPFLLPLPSLFFSPHLSPPAPPLFPSNLLHDLDKLLCWSGLLSNQLSCGGLQRGGMTHNHYVASVGANLESEGGREGVDDDVEADL